jgi:hypothetical protein
MITGVLSKFRNCVVGVLAFALTTTMVAPLHAMHAHEAAHEYRSNLGTAALQKAVRALAKVLRSPAIEKVLTYVRDAGKKDIARVIQKNSGTIANTLDAIAELDYLTVAFVRDNVMKALVAAGVQREIARITGFWIEQVLTIVP